ncbi:YggT family protein [Corynebacterium sp.]|uniref:YggT family protein n=1 Tax=Corynebacterium sp. TaxID=1720 RepID=UPI0026DDC3B0|nr:YggT family protein [Corynebacterium sp.]MDO4609132.1 YggT family protein [Corynebacterium sp.]
MQVLFSVLYILVQLFTYLLLVRIIIEMIESFSRSWRPGRVFSTIGEVVFTVTDPPVKLVRRIIPSMPMGAVRLDISVLVLFFVLMIVRMLLAPFSAI